MNIYREILSALEHEDVVMLATIISTSGSTPAAAFSKMLIRGAGTSSVGTVGGGCMEGDVLEAAKRLVHRKQAQVLTFHLSETEMIQGLICGGSLDILIEPLTRFDTPLVAEIITRCGNGEDSVIATFLDDAGITKWKHLVGATEKQMVEFLCGLPDLQLNSDGLRAVASKVLHRNETQVLTLPGGRLFLEPLAGMPELLIFGGGHVSRYISSVASLAGFRVTVIDDRPQFANPRRFPEAERTLAVEFYEAFTMLSVKASTYIVIVTRGHRSDEELLEQAVKTPARYIGMIGSKRKVLSTYGHLVERGVSVAALAKVHAPMGIEIGAVTAEEIAVSVVAEMIRVRRGESTSLHHKSSGMKDLLCALDPKQTVQSS
jgi:xanthine dehydrogenase accessory factor